MTEKQLATAVVAELQRRGYTAVLAGGCVRDEILGRTPKDYDVATSARPEAVESVFPRTIAVGKAFGVIIVVDGQAMVEVATLRADGQYSDGRRPESVQYVTSLREDAARRDFTMNAMFRDPLTGEVFDFFGGQEDLARRVIRAVGNPQERIEEDRLRMLRVARFAARYGFEIDPLLTGALTRNAAEINAVIEGRRAVSFERIANELEGILTSPHPLTGLDVLMDTGLMRQILPEIAECDTAAGEQDPVWHPEGNTWVHTRKVVGNLTGGSFPLMLGGLLHDVGKPRTQERHADGRISNHGHAELGAEMACAITRRLKMSNECSHRVVELVRLHMTMHAVDELRRSKLVALLERDDIQDLIALQHADATGTGCPDCQERSRRDFLKAKLKELSEAAEAAQRPGATPLVTGDVLIGMGFTPGPAFKGMLSEALDAQREGAFSDAEKAKEWVRQRFGQA
jgi:poly(A) polymerase